MEKLAERIQQVAVARKSFVLVTSGISPVQAHFKPGDDEWSIVDNVEHLVWAEMGGINGLWKTLEAVKQNRPLWKGALIHQGLTIEEIVDKTWAKEELAPEIAKPKWGGAIDYWIVSLNNCQLLLESLSKALMGYDPYEIIHPHPISGPLDVIQRMEFLRFHMDRHRAQVARIKSHADYPKSSNVTNK